MTAIALVSWQWISPFLERYVDEIGRFLPYTNLEARFISMTMESSRKYALLDANLYDFWCWAFLSYTTSTAKWLFLSSCLKPGSYKVCLCVLLFTELRSTFSVETHLHKIAMNFILVHEKNHTRNTHRHSSLWTLDMSDQEVHIVS